MGLATFRRARRARVASAASRGLGPPESSDAPPAINVDAGSVEPESPVAKAPTGRAERRRGR